MGSLCLVCLRLGVGRAEVAGVFRAPLPPGADEEPAFLQELSAFLIASRIPAGVRVTLGVPRGEFILRRFETPPVKARNLPALVGFEMDRHLPGRREDFLCGWRVDGRTADGGYLVLLGATRKAAVERPAALLRRANLAPASIQPETFALADLLRRASGVKGDALLVDLGHTSVGLDFIRRGRPELSWIVPVDDPQWRDARRLRRQLRLRSLPPASSRSVRRPPSASVPCSPRGSRRRCSASRSPGGRSPSCTSAAMAPTAARLLEKLQLGRRPRCARFALAAGALGQGARRADTLHLLAGTGVRRCGLQAAGLELDPERQEELHRAPSLRLSAALALVLVAVLVAHLAAYGLRQQRQLALADREIRALKTKMAKVDEVNRLVQDQRVAAGLPAATVRGRARPPEILRELTGLLPDTAYLSELTFRERTVEITGLAPSASQLLPVIEASPLFSGVEFSAPIVAQGAGLERFRIRMRLEAAGG